MPRGQHKRSPDHLQDLMKLEIGFQPLRLQDRTRCRVAAVQGKRYVLEQKSVVDLAQPKTKRHGSRGFKCVRPFTEGSSYLILKLRKPADVALPTTGDGQLPVLDFGIVGKPHPQVVQIELPLNPAGKKHARLSDSPRTVRSHRGSIGCGPAPGPDQVRRRSSRARPRHLGSAVARAAARRSRGKPRPPRAGALQNAMLPFLVPPENPPNAAEKEVARHLRVTLAGSYLDRALKELRASVGLPRHLV